MKIRKFNDTLALFLLVLIIPALWILNGLGKLEMPGEIIGATIAGWTTVLYFYFRKSPPAE